MRLIIDYRHHYTRQALGAELFFRPLGRWYRRERLCRVNCRDRLEKTNRLTYISTRQLCLNESAPQDHFP